jgi:uncharacterized protein
MSDTPEWVVSREDYCLIHVHVQPGAKISGPVGLHGSRLKWKLKAPPVDGKANTELIESVAEFFQIKKSDISIKSGETSRTKTLQISTVKSDYLLTMMERKLKKSDY